MTQFAKFQFVELYKKSPVAVATGDFLLLQMGFVDEDMDIVQLLLGNSGGGIHHQILCVLVHGEGNDLTNRLLAAQQHDDTVDAGGCACVGRCAVSKGIVHCGELSLHVLFALSVTTIPRSWSRPSRWSAWAKRT